MNLLNMNESFNPMPLILDLDLRLIFEVSKVLQNVELDIQLEISSYGGFSKSSILT